ncbi:MAG: nuclear transport factor 2 family protein [Lachnospiraceae bacterium]|nr:nuclear transport factor 2 family protein [Lachnospiraceae bacterium]
MKEVYDISEKIWNAIIYDKVEQLEKYVHEEAVFVHMGVTLKRDNEIAIMKEGRINIQTVEFQEKTIQQMESTVVLLNKVKMTAIVGGKEVENPFVVTEVYTISEDTIKLASMSYTRILY